MRELHIDAEMINIPNSITAIYANGEGPNELNSSGSWKTKSKYDNTTSQDFNIDLSKSFLIGDRLSDIQAGHKAGLKNLVHVLTGHGNDERKVIENYCELNNSINLRLIDDISYLKKVVF